MRELSPALRAKLQEAAKRVAEHMGFALHQEHKMHNGAWWLFTLGKPVRALTEEEISWHTERQHWPFVENGLRPGDAHWWDDPK